MTYATSYRAALPEWLLDDLETLPTSLPRGESRMALVNELADRNWRAGNGGPFAAIVVDNTTDEVVAVGVNVVLSSGLSSAHAEVTALSLAQSRLGRWDLGAEGADLELVVNWRPCVMCYGATMWSGVRSLVVAGEGPLLEELTGFDEGPVVDDWAEQFERRGIRVTVGVGHEAALGVYRSYGAADVLVYNARGAIETES
ncbi:tRNA(Arg) A34 adenosine deaminase TadA [Microbacterium endophyticum]|uniref:tRNA(Arg) A34 adenosine deaminase TadA n=1 Tax=Microbacterium endophyticum TaxID=1526412 RepID=A0A7W4V4Q6_9MICO|nr:deaminase [Microbacterium endophyticum]MBB2976806.1 tRNA(Arg) A34 adenosine deaminase TadA [Microbacterium endophyticum]NIK36557.1 tRNA(Arg) A34 adenosine deaminase TadA [Microbacterium endophyticum]